MIPAKSPTIDLKPIQIGPITVETPLALAPMAGQTNHAFRTLCRETGDCGLVCSEVLSSNAIHNPGGYHQSLRLFDWMPEESPIAVQLSGSIPEVMAHAARVVVDHGAEIVDINMGCWVPKIAKKKGEGAALMRDLDTATAVVQAVIGAVDVPVTVKIRSGWDAEQPTAVTFARAAEQAGVQAIAVHARFAEQGFTGTADWSVIRDVKEAVQHIPVFGNGDVFSGADARRMLLETGCDGVMVGRGALGNPWIFKQIAHELRTGEPLPQPTLAERAQMAIQHAERSLATSNFPERKVLYELRGQLAKYVVDIPEIATIREKIVRADSLEDIKTAFAPMLNGERA